MQPSTVSIYSSSFECRTMLAGSSFRINPFYVLVLPHNQRFSLELNAPTQTINRSSTFDQPLKHNTSSHYRWEVCSAIPSEHSISNIFSTFLVVRPALSKSNHDFSIPEEGLRQPSADGSEHSFFLSALKWHSGVIILWGRSSVARMTKVSCWGIERPDHDNFKTQWRN
jgi:hypothetical protein